jgi:3-oxoadipate enol-lactonase
MTTGTIQIAGGELSYERRGDGGPVVLLHGGALNSQAWDGQVAPLAEHHTVIRYDLRGHGRSSTPIAPFAHCEDLRQLLDALDISRASLVGLSLGARTAIDFALSCPDRVDRLFLAGPGIGGMTFHDPFILDQLTKLAEAAAAGDVDRALECVVRMWVDGPYRTPDAIDPRIRKRARTVVLPGVGHNVNLERPEEFNRMVLEFLSRPS